MNRLLVDEIRLLSFDPGSRCLGMAVQSLDPVSFKTTLIHAETLKVDRYIDKNSEAYLTEGEFQARLAIIRKYVLRCCSRWAPVSIAIELPYMGRRPQAFGALKEVLLTLRLACREYNSMRTPFLYEPSVVKKVHGVPGTNGDKELMRAALINSDDILIPDNINVQDLDEHAIDAALIGHTHVVLGIQKKDTPNGTKPKKKSKKRKSKKRSGK